jgi:glycerol-3-phosphate dehydrogenase
MVRDLRRLADTHFDLIVVGAGFYGAIAAWDATLRGLSVALIDKNDFGAATSFNNLKTLHGGLRSLQSLNLRQMRLFVRERRALARIAPHLMRPMPFVIPTYRQPKRSATVMRAALAINDVLSRDRHEGLEDPGLHLPDSEVLSREECLRLNPLIDPDGITGGALWHDYQMHNTDRMTLSFVLSAAELGAAAANYVRATSVVHHDGRVQGVRVEDQLTAEAFDVRATAVVNAAGPWASSMLASLGARTSSPAPRLSRAMNLVTTRIETTHGCGGLTGGRFLFLIPWRNVSLIGTSHDAHTGSPDDLTVTARDLETFVADARRAFPRAPLTTADVRLVHRGLLPMISGDDRHVRLLRESLVVDHARHGAAGLISMFGVRYTTARATAARAIDAIFRNRGMTAPPPCRTEYTPLIGGAMANKERFLTTAVLENMHVASQDSLSRLALTYGTTYDAPLELIRRDPALAAPLGTQCPVTAAEIVHAVRSESAVKLSDALIRRTEAGSAGHPGSDAIQSAADLMARECHWDQQRVRTEIEETERFYELPR